MTKASDLLEAEEIAFVRRALLQWSGPAHCNDRLATGMGFAGESDLRVQADRLAEALGSDLPMPAVDWARTLITAEITFASDLAGAGSEWRTVTGLDDAYSIEVLRSVQRKLGRTISPYYGGRPIE
ncbi:hypothetical protein AB0J38_22815 [Streptomyces sp. NPDC050095]|uniref:hypothetical protein n=1 Tax=unclassified Streptomyces TaxID=2593676 RepID=UPI003438B1B3